MRPSAVPPGWGRNGVPRNPLLVTASSEAARTEMSPDERWPGTTLIEAVELLARAQQPEPMTEALELLTHQSESIKRANAVAFPSGSV
jgi:hypothetical protein